MVNVTQVVWGPQSSWFWTMVQSIGVLVTLAAIYSQIRLQRHANMLPLFAHLEERWWSERMVGARERACLRFLDPSARDDSTLTADEDAILTFLEDVGLYIKRGILDERLVWEKLSHLIDQYWQMLEPRVAGERRVDKTYFSHVAFLRARMLRISDRQGAQSRHDPASLTALVAADLQRLRHLN